MQKLGFLKRQLAVGAVDIAAVAMRSLLDDPNSLCLVGECRELEKHLGTNCTDAILQRGDEVSSYAGGEESGKASGQGSHVLFVTRTTLLPTPLDTF